MWPADNDVAAVTILREYNILGRAQTLEPGHPIQRITEVPGMLSSDKSQGHDSPIQT